MILIFVIVGVLTTVYALTVASFAWEDLAFGLGLAVVLVVTFRRSTLPDKLQSPLRTLEAIVWAPIYATMVTWTIITGTFSVALFVLGLRKLEHPGIVAVPIGERSPAGVAVTELALTLSPGSFFVDMDWDEEVFYVHVMDASDPDGVRAELQTMYDRYQRHVVP